MSRESLLFYFLTQGLAMYVWAVFRLIMYLILTLLLQSLQCRGYRHVSRLQACVTMPEHGSVSCGVEASLSWISFGFTGWILSANQVSYPPALP